MTSGRGPRASGVSAPNSDQLFLHVRAGMTVIVEEGKDLRMADVIWVDGGARNPKVLTLLQVADEHRPHQLGQRLPGDPHRFKGLICTLPWYQMTCPVSENAIRFTGMKNHLAYIGGGVIVAVMFLAVFVGGANAGDCTRSLSADAPAAKGHH